MSSCKKSQILHFLLLSFVCYRTTAYPNFQGNIPNGGNVPDPCQPNITWPGVGHQAKQGSGPRNPFGLDFFSNRFVWTPALCRLDSDGDGLTNGQELGDPNCVWSPNSGDAPAITKGLSHPGICEPLSSPKCLALNQWLSCKPFSCPAWSLNSTKSVSLTFPPSLVPAQQTTYMCMSVNLPNDSTYHIVGYKPLPNNTNVIHHILLYGCPNGMDATNSFPVPSVCGMGLRSCPTVLAVWSVGLPGECFSDQYGLLMGGVTGVKYAVLQVHWNNPQLIPNQYDNSGLMLYYTSIMRPHNGQVVIVGQNYLNIPPGQASVATSGSCVSECSQFMPYNVSIASTFLHMHLLGKAGSVELISGDTSVKILSAPQYDYNSPAVLSYVDAIPFSPGDEIRVNCVFDSIGRNTTTIFGEATTDEMCVAFVTIYPAINKFDRCYTWKDLPTVCPISTLLSYPRCNYVNFQSLLTLAEAKCDANCSKSCLGLVNLIYKTGCFDGDLGVWMNLYIVNLYPTVKPLLNVIENICAPLLPSTISTMRTSSTTLSSPISSAPKSPASDGVQVTGHSTMSMLFAFAILLRMRPVIFFLIY